MHTRAYEVHLCERRGKSRDDVNDPARSVSNLLFPLSHFLLPHLSPSVADSAIANHYITSGGNKCSSRSFFRRPPVTRDYLTNFAIQHRVRYSLVSFLFFFFSFSFEGRALDRPRRSSALLYPRLALRRACDPRQRSTLFPFIHYSENWKQDLL